MRVNYKYNPVSINTISTGNIDPEETIDEQFRPS